MLFNCLSSSLVLTVKHFSLAFQGLIMFVTDSTDIHKLDLVVKYFLANYLVCALGSVIEFARCVIEALRDAQNMCAIAKGGTVLVGGNVV